MNARVLRNWLGWPIAAGILIFFAGWVGLAGLDRVESDREFCVSCHLPDGSPLHQPKFNLGRMTPPLDGASLHFQQNAKGRLSCADCHRGTGVGGRSQIIWGSMVNTARYFFSEFKEPTRLNHPIQDAACTVCHQVNQGTIDRTRFHRIKAHLYPIPVQCTACHLGHAPDATHNLPEPAAREAFTAVLAGTMMGVCGRCHDVRPPTEQVRVVVEKATGFLFPPDGTPASAGNPPGTSSAKTSQP